MNIEIEAKVKVESHEAVVEKLRQHGAEFVATLDQRDTYFDDADKKLLSNDKGLRVRRQVVDGIEQVVLTLKGARAEGKYKTRPEHNIEVGNQAELVNVLGGLGFEKCMVVEKIRQMWKLNDCDVCLDQLPLLGKFVEVEGPSEAKIDKTLEMLGLGGLTHVGAGYARLMADVLEQDSLNREV